MKINIQVDITPEELRKVMGWPDVEPFQQEMLDKLKQQMESGAEGYDPLTLMQPYLAQSGNSMETLQKMIAGIAGSYFSSGDKGADK